MNTSSIELPCTVASYAEASDFSVSTIYRAIRKGYLQTKGKRPVQIVSGELPLKPDQWRDRIEHVAQSVLRPGTFGFADNRFEYLVGDRAYSIPFHPSPSHIEQACVSIRSAAERLSTKANS